MTPIIDHIHITVSDLARAEAFYDHLLPLFGFNLKNKEKDAVPESDYSIIEYYHRNFSLGIVNPRATFRNEPVNRRKPGALHHLAFHTDSRSEVDLLFEKIKQINTEIVHSLRLYPEYCKDYYAFFFKDSEGIEHEVVHFNRADSFK